VPESFKVLVKELQSLCLDIKVLDKDGEEIELKDDEEDDFIPGFKEDSYSSDDEIVSEGFSIEDVPDEEPDRDLPVDDYTVDDEEDN
jgi:DNA-directed RNA polymerase subunit beta